MGTRAGLNRPFACRCRLAESVTAGVGDRRTSQSETDDLVPADDLATAAEFDEHMFDSQLIDVSHTAVAIVGPDLQVYRTNRAMRSITGLSADQLAGKALPELLPDIDPRAWRLIDRVIATGRPIPDVEIPGTTPALGPQQHISRVSHFPLRDRRGVTVAVGVTLTDVTARRQAEAERDAVQRRLQLLGRASSLIGGSLELSATLDGITDLLVPEFADMSSLFLVDEPLDAGARPDALLLRRATPSHLASALPTPADARFATVGNLFSFNPSSPPYLALAAGQPVRAEMSDQTIREYDMPGVGAYFRHLGLRWVISVPLLVGGSFHGILFTCLGDSGRTYTDHDLQTAADVGSRVASAVANARAYARQRQVSVALQRSLLPPGIPAVEGIEIAWRYEPGGTSSRQALLPDRAASRRPAAGRPPGPAVGTEVGGDWFDVIPLSAGRFAFVIGDVVGRGLTAAAAMGQVSAAARAFAALDLPADDVLTHLDNLVQAIPAGPDGALVSCVYAIFEPATATITLANAGHLPPALRDPDGQVRLLENAGGALLGLGGQTFTESRHPFPVGATLTLYTDGLVEAPGVDLEEGLQRLRRGLTEPGRADATADRLMSLIDHAGGYDDDVTLLVVHAAAGADTDTVAAELTSDPGDVRRARHVVRAALRDWQLPEAADTVELLVSELLTNAIRYSRHPGDLVLRRAADALYIEVSDSDGRVPRIMHPNNEEEHGRGLILVSTLATRWGTRPTRAGKTVWCEVDTGQVLL
jgi:PAS domain S-box-containing protein